MTDIAPRVADSEADVPLDPTVREQLSRLRRPLLVVVLVLVAALLVAALKAQSARGYLDPDSAAPSGARAARVLLTEQGVAVTATRTTAAAVAAATPGSTLLVVGPDLLQPEQLAALTAVRADLVLVGAGPAALDALAPGVRPVQVVPVEDLDPVCGLPAAQRAGRARTGGVVYTVTRSAGTAVDRCYAVAGRPSVVRLVQDGRTVTLLGSGDLLTNGQLGREGNAALGLGVLGANPRLVWYRAVPEVAAGGQRSLRELLPTWVWLASAQLVVAVLLLALWRARRLGRIVAEPLPVVVRAAETTEGRARLYRRAGARDRAAATLRAAAVQRLRPALGLPRTAEAVEVAAAVAARSGRPEADVAALLYGAAPRDDAALARLADDLDALERTVRSL